VHETKSIEQVMCSDILRTHSDGIAVPTQNAASIEGLRSFEFA